LACDDAEPPKDERERLWQGAVLNPFCLQDWYDVSEWKESCLFRQGSLELNGCHARVLLERGVKPGYGIEPGVDRQFQY